MTEPAETNPEEEEPTATFGFVGPEDGEVYAFNFMGYADEVDSPTIAEADEAIAEIIKLATRLTTPATAETVTRAFTLIRGGLADGQLTSDGVGDFVRWLWYTKGVAAITPAMLAGGAFAGFMLTYARAHDYSPPAAPGKAEATRATPGQRAVHAAAITVQGQSVTAPGLSAPETTAISKAIGIAYSDALRVQAAVVDRMLPNMAPGQVPEALTDLFRAVRIITRQLATLQSTANTVGTKATKGQLAALNARYLALGAELGKVTDQLAAQVPSGLLSDIEGLKAGQAATHEALSHLEAGITAAGGAAGLSTLAGDVTKLQRQVGLVEPSKLDSALNHVSAVAADAARVADDAALCCEAQTTNLANTVKSLGGSSGLASLGKLVGLAFGLTTAATLIGTVQTILKLPAEVGLLVQDAETVSGWVSGALGVATADLSWAGTLASAKPATTYVKTG